MMEWHAMARDSSTMHNGQRSTSGLGAACVAIGLAAVGLGLTGFGIWNVLRGWSFEGWIQAGLGLLWLLPCLLYYRSSRRWQRLMDSHPPAPWLPDEDWVLGRVRSVDQRDFWPGTVFGIFGGVVFAAAAWATLRLPKNSSVGWLFLLIGLIWISFPVMNARRRRNFGFSILRLQTLPGRIGEGIGGTIEIPKVIAPAEGFQVCLRAFPAHSSEHPRIIWQSPVVSCPGLHVEEGRTDVPFLLPLPAHVPESGAATWILEARASMPGSDYLSHFVVPVYRCPDQRETCDIESPA